MANDPYAKRHLWFIFLGSRGGLNRLKLIQTIRKTPLNANQLSKELGLDYKSIQHHINVFLKNNIITSIGEKYGVLYFTSSFLQENMETFDDIVNKLEKSN